MNLTFACYITACSSFHDRMEFLNRTVTAFEQRSSFPCVHRFIVDDCPGSSNATELFGWPRITSAGGSQYREARIVANHLRAAKHLSELESQENRRYDATANNHLTIPFPQTLPP